LLAHKSAIDWVEETINGEYLLSLSRRDNDLRLWHVDTRKSDANCLKKNDPIISCHFAFDDKLIILVSKKKLEFFNFSDPSHPTFEWNKSINILQKGEYKIPYFVFHKKRMLIMIKDDRERHFEYYDLECKNTLFLTSVAKAYKFKYASEDGKWLVLGEESSKILRIYNLKENTLIEITDDCKPFTGCSLDSKYFICGNETLQIYDATNFTIMERFIIKEKNNTLSKCMISPNGDLLLFSVDNKLKIRPFTNLRKCKYQIEFVHPTCWYMHENILIVFSSMEPFEKSLDDGSNDALSKSRNETNFNQITDEAKNKPIKYRKCVYEIKYVDNTFHVRQWVGSKWVVVRRV